MTTALRHPLHLIAIAAGMVGVAIGVSNGEPRGLTMVALSLAFLSAIDLARRLGLEPPDDPAAPHNRGKT